MALRQLMISKKITLKREQLKVLREAAEGFATREADLEKAIEEATTEEEEATVNEEIDTFDADKKKNEEDQSALEKEISELEEELKKENDKPADASSTETNNERGKELNIMRRNTILGKMTSDQRSAFLADTQVKDFLVRVRALKGNQRAVAGVELTIPVVMLDLLRDNINKYSKLISHIRLKPVKGKARQNIMGTIPEAVWTEATGKINSVGFSFNQIEVDGYKVAGYIAIPNSYIEDSDENLAEEIMENLSQAIGFAVDKAVIYGTGTKMPLGIITRLAQTVSPVDYSADAPVWTDLHTSNIVKIDGTTLTDTKFFAALIKKCGIAKENYSDGKKVWCMNSTTKTDIMSKAINFNAGGALVAGVNDEMPIIGGKIVTLDFIPDGDIIGGFESLYLLAEREGAYVTSSTHALFLDDQTAYKGVARYDGRPVMPGGFVAININNVDVTTTVTFASDTANA